MRVSVTADLMASLLVCAIAHTQTGPRNDLNELPAFIGAAELEEKAKSGTSLRSRDFSGRSLAGLQLRDTDLTATVWTKSDLRGARFTNCTLSDADFSGAFLGGAAFEGCSLKGARFAAASLRGAFIRTCDLSGATFEGADTAGATLVDVTLSPTGAPYLPALQAATTLASGVSYSPTLIAAASGDAFAFTYCRKDRTGWPGRPMTFNPLVLALDTLGFDTSAKPSSSNLDVARKDLSTLLRRGLVAILPLRLAGAGLDGDAVEGPVWVVAHELVTASDGEESVRLSTPFGPMTLPMDDLLRRWRGPWPTLSPIGQALAMGRYPLVTVGALKKEVSEQEAIVKAMQHASAILTEARSFEDAYGGLQAYEALLKDIADEQVVLGDLVHWSGGPRLALAASRSTAAAFLTESAPKMPASAQGPMQDAAALYVEVVRLLLDEWPVPGPNDFEKGEVLTAANVAAARRPSAAVVLQGILERERRALSLLDQAVQETKRAGIP